MVDDLPQVRRLRREAFKDKLTLNIADSLDADLVEDILNASPEVADIQFQVLEDRSFDTRTISNLIDVYRLKILEGPNLSEINLEGLANLNYLEFFELNVSPSNSLPEIDLTPLAGHKAIKIITIACPTRSIKLDGLNNCPHLYGMGFYNLDYNELNLTPLSDAKKLESIFIQDFGRDTDQAETFKIIPPKRIPLKVLNIQDAVNDKLVLEIDWTFLEGREAMDEITLKNCNLNSFDLNRLTPLDRLGTLDLSDNPMTDLDITPIIDMPMFSKKALGQEPFVLDESVILHIERNREEDIERILELPDVILDYHDGHFAIEYEFGHQWLRKLMEDYSFEWI